jgi:hypothetical protein
MPPDYDPWIIVRGHGAPPGNSRRLLVDDVERAINVPPSQRVKAGSGDLAGRAARVAVRRLLTPFAGLHFKAAPASLKTVLT